MATNILALEWLSFPLTIGNNEDWIDSFPTFVDTNNNPTSLAGLVLNFMVRSAPTDPTAQVVASTASTVSGLPTNGTVTIGGAGNNVAALNIPRSWMMRLPGGSYVFELQGQGDGVTRTLASGPLTVIEGVIR